MPSYVVHNTGSGVVNISSSNQYNYYGGGGGPRSGSATSYTYSTNGQGNVYTYSTSFNTRNPDEPRIATIASSDDSLFPSLANARNATNHLYLTSTNHPVYGAYRIDPKLEISRALLSDTAAKIPVQQRSSLQAETQNGSIHLNIGLAPPSRDPLAGTPAQNSTARQKARLVFQTMNGSAMIRIAPTTPRPPFRLLAASMNGSVSVYIPRSFHGPVTLQSINGGIRVSRDIKQSLIVLSDEGDTQKCFIGNTAGYNGQAHSGLDELMLKSNNGSVSLFYASERAADQAISSTGKASVEDAGSVMEDKYEEVRHSVEEEVPTMTTETFGDGIHTIHTNYGGGVYNNVSGVIRSFWPSPARRSTQ